MTLREKLEIEHPECIGEKWYGGCKDCPHQYGYETSKEGECDSKTVNDDICRKCWDRKYEGELTPQEKKIEELESRVRHSERDKEYYIKNYFEIDTHLCRVRDHVNQNISVGDWIFYYNSEHVCERLIEVFDSLRNSRNRWRAAWFGLLAGNILAFILGFFI